jgi:phosphohistidine swiveling domain-containing protein
MTRLMTGLGTLPNTRLTYGLMTLSEVARAEPRVKAFLSSADDQAMRSYRSKLASTRFLDGFEALLNEFGHRGRFESDVMSVRFGEDPEPSLRMVQLYLRAGTLEDRAGTRLAGRASRWRRRRRSGHLRTDRWLLFSGRSPGTLTGTIKIVQSAADMRALSGEIVVLSAIEPSVTPLFPVVGGVIAEIGGVLSHAAILAREYSLPAVVNVKDATRRLRDGDRMQLNGATGRIRVLGCVDAAGDGHAAVAQRD